MAEPKTAKRATGKSEGKPRRKKKAAAEPRSRGIAPDAIGAGTPPAAVTRLAESIEADGGSVLAPYKDPLGGHWQIFAALPIDLVEPTPYQRDLSQPHVERLSAAMDKLGRYLDPMIVVRSEQPETEGRERREGREGERPYWTPNGNHRLAALRQLGAKSVVAIVVPGHRSRPPDPAAQHREGAQPARALAGGDPAGRPAGGDREPAGEGLRDRVRGAGAADAGPLLSGERPLCRWRVPPDPAPGGKVARPRRCRRRWR